MKTLILAASVLILATAAQAAEIKQPAGAQQTPTRIETDPKTGALLFIVNGREQARIDATGLHVRDSIDYEGTLTDGSTVYRDDYPPAAKGKRKP